MGTVEELSRRAVFAERHGKFLPVDLCPTIAVRMNNDAPLFSFMAFTWLYLAHPWFLYFLIQLQDPPIQYQVVSHGDWFLPMPTRATLQLVETHIRGSEGRP